jgi:hypothetical protein
VNLGAHGDLDKTRRWAELQTPIYVRIEMVSDWLFFVLWLSQALSSQQPAASRQPYQL